jgi:hypothetical protein
MFTISSMDFRDADLEVDDPKILNNFREYLHSSDPRIRRFACSMLGNISVHGPAGLGSIPCWWITPLLRSGVFLVPRARSIYLNSDEDVEVRRCAIHALSKLSSSSMGA